MKNSQKSRPDTPKLSFASRGIKRIVDMKTAVKNVYDSLSKERYANLLKAYTTDAINPPSWSLAKSASFFLNSSKKSLLLPPKPGSPAPLMTKSEDIKPTPSKITSSTNSLLTTATICEQKKRIEQSVRELKLNDANDPILVQLQDKIDHASQDRMKASQKLSEVSSRSPDLPYCPKWTPHVRIYGEKEDEDEEADEDEENGEEEYADEREDGEEEQVPSLTVINDFIRNRLSTATDDEILISKAGFEIRTKDLDTLVALNWLNDEVINFYFQLIMQRSQQVDNLPRVYVFSTFFYDKLRASENSYATLKRWTRKVDIFSHDYVLIPLHLGMHWALASINCKTRRICYYDSLTPTSLINQNGQSHQMLLLKYLKLEHQDKKKSELPDDWAFCAVGQDDNNSINVTIPQQQNGSDCGVFSCKFAECISRRSPFKFSQAHMPYIRRRMIYEILRGELAESM